MNMFRSSLVVQLFLSVNLHAVTLKAIHIQDIRGDKQDERNLAGLTKP